jgi:hypothetical protein
MKTASQNNNSSGLAETILHAIRGLKYGSLEIIVHDAKVVRIEKHERIRIDVDSEESLDRYSSHQHR